MRIKLVVIDLEIPARVKKWALRIGIPSAMLLSGGAAFADIHSWSQGDTLNASDLNASFTYVRDQITALRALTHPASAFRASYSGTLNIANGAATKVVFDTVQFDVAGEYNTTTGAFTPKNPGIYLVTCTVHWQAPPSGTNVSVILVKGFPNQLSARDQGSGAGKPHTASVTTTAQLMAGEAITCYAQHDSGSPLALGSSYPDRVSFSATRLH